MALVAGRALQGAGAVSAAVTALLADQTRDEVRTKAMALVGGSIGVMFALALELTPVLAAHVGLSGLFSLTGVLALGGIGVIVWVTPEEPQQHKNAPRGRLADVLRDARLLRMNFSVFALHSVQMAMWVAVPALMVSAGLPKAQHWEIYLPAVLGSFVLMGAGLFRLERQGHLRLVLRLAIFSVAVVQMGLWGITGAPTLGVLGGLMFLFFCGFNVLEASLPSLMSRLAPATMRGAALGVYNTAQSLGLFAGGAIGGLLIKELGPHGLFVATATMSLLWLVAFWGLEIPARTH